MTVSSHDRRDAGDDATDQAGESEAVNLTKVFIIDWRN